MFLKVCGITRLPDARLAIEHGATALGFIFWPGSPRYVSPAQAGAIIGELPLWVTAVGVFVNETVDGICEIAAHSGISAVQLHGEEPPDYADALGWPVLRSATLENIDRICSEWPARSTTLLLDAADPVRRGGTGRTIDWPRAAGVAGERRIILAGGLTAANVAEAIATVRPYGVDVSSGIESAPGQKDAALMACFLEEGRRAFEVLLPGGLSEAAAAGGAAER
jgi:phosphoribosylanthranilate isomerase